MKKLILPLALLVTASIGNAGVVKTSVWILKHPVKKVAVVGAKVLKTVLW